jgi:hypothetical protein
MLKLGIKAQALLLPTSPEHTSVFITKLRKKKMRTEKLF